ncbi:MAG TPA: hypothetical protein VEA37_13585, partial [Flavobacterium sp.]|nr:hypothetical protein [Flavobacterium sp.]
MTREEILAMKPGRELDALVAEKVLNLSVERWGEYAVVLNSAFGGTPIVVADDEKSVLYRFPHKSDWVKKYSTDISAAWEVVKKMEDCLHLKEHGERG